MLPNSLHAVNIVDPFSAYSPGASQFSPSNRLRGLAELEDSLVHRQSAAHGPRLLPQGVQSEPCVRKGHAGDVCVERLGCDSQD